MKPLLLDDNDGDEETTTEARRVEGEKEIIEKVRLKALFLECFYQQCERQGKSYFAVMLISHM